MEATDGNTYGMQKVLVWSIFYPGEHSYFFLSALLGLCIHFLAALPYIFI